MIPTYSISCVSYIFEKDPLFQFVMQDKIKFNSLLTLHSHVLYKEIVVLSHISAKKGKQNTINK